LFAIYVCVMLRTSCECEPDVSTPVCLSPVERLALRLYGIVHVFLLCCVCHLRESLSLCLICESSIEKEKSKKKKKKKKKKKI
jgi:hypothetical protein